MDLVHPTQISLQDLNEEVAIPNLPVQGALPAWLEGTLIRNGPAKFHFNGKQIGHWFDGLAMLHAFTFGEGKVSYRNRFIRSDAYCDATDHGRLNFMGFAQDPCKSVFQRFFAYFLPSLTPTLVQNANVNVMRIAQHYVALTETPLPVRFDPETLATLGVLDYQDTLPKKDCFESAHPHHDQRRMETVNLQIELGRHCQYRLYSVADNAVAQRKTFFEMQSDRASYMHTFALTKNYAVLVEFPLVLNALDLLIRGGGYISQFQWQPQRNTRFHVISRTDGLKVKTYETEAFFCFHHVNAYEDQDTIVVDLIRHPDAQIVFGDPGIQPGRRLERFRIDLNRAEIQAQTLAETLLELPRIHDNRSHCLPYNYVYGVGFHYPTSRRDAIPLLKINVQAGSVLEWKEPGALAGEPIFVPGPDAKAEDDGIVLSLVVNEEQAHSFLLVLDARDWHEVARSGPLHPIPYGLHGMFTA